MISDNNNTYMNVFLDIQIDTDKSDWQQIEVDLLLWNSSLPTVFENKLRLFNNFQLL